jgi:hypothetical protein
LGRRIKAAGFLVQSEYKVCCVTKGRKIDWVWLDSQSHTPIVAFEIEGRYVNPKSQGNDFEKFAHCSACINVLAMVQLRHDGSPKKIREGTPREWVERHFAAWHAQRVRDGASAIVCPEIYRDCDLMAPGGIEGLQRLAQQGQAGQKLSI